MTGPERCCVRGKPPFFSERNPNKRKNTPMQAAQKLHGRFSIRRFPDRYFRKTSYLAKEIPSPLYSSSALFPSPVIPVNSVFPSGIQWCIAPESTNGFTEDLIIQGRALRITVEIGSPICPNPELFGGFHCVNIGAQEEKFPAISGLPISTVIRRARP